MKLRKKAQSSKGPKRKLPLMAFALLAAVILTVVWRDRSRREVMNLAAVSDEQATGDSDHGTVD